MPVTDGGAMLHRARDIGLGFDHGVRERSRLASSAAIAAENVQPVPCVLRLTMRGARNSVQLAPVEQHVHHLVSRQVPALDDHARVDRARARAGRPLWRLDES